ncbi:MAG: YidC/Oxa1 family membrane protein insertase [Candidatus Pacebacteria bacterium]|nr:YidC/Oxa1 family membrane protein insertase [Candidatus Paceibacterota bacterium]
MFHEYLYKPLFNALIFLYENVSFGDMGIAIILLTIFVRVILFPIFYKSIKNQTLMQKLQPALQKIQHDHKHDKEKQARATMELYKQHKVNPFSSIFLLLAQLPVLFALLQVFNNFYKLPLEELVKDLYGFLSRPEIINFQFLNLIDLKSSSMLIVVLAAIAQYFQGKLALPKQNKDEKNGALSANLTKQMVFIGPLISLMILWSLPAAIGIYWLTSSIFSVVQQIYINKKIAKEEESDPLLKQAGIKY